MKTTISAVTVIAALAAAGCASNSDLGLGPVNTNGPPSDFLSPAASPGPSHQQRHHHRHHHHPAQVAAAGLVRVHDPGQVTGTVSGPCHARDGGRLPDRRCTPGAYDPAVTRAVLCSGGYSTDSYRPPESQTDAFKFSEAYPAYSIAAGTTSELDHLIPLELGGANDAANLWPEVGPLPNPKDHVENALHDAVCSGRVAPGTAPQASFNNAGQAGCQREWLVPSVVKQNHSGVIWLRRLVAGDLAEFRAAGLSAGTSLSAGVPAADRAGQPGLKEEQQQSIQGNPRHGQRQDQCDSNGD
jgi:hypothetical protein